MLGTRKKPHTPTHSHTCTHLHIYHACKHALLQSHTHGNKLTYLRQSFALVCKRMRTQAHTAHKHIYANPRTRPAILSDKCSTLYKKGWKLITKEYSGVWICLHVSNLFKIYLFLSITELCVYTPAFVLKILIKNKI